MIPLSDTDKPHTYAYVAGCRNVLWLSGIVRSLDREGKVIHVSRTDQDEILPVHLSPGDYLPVDLKEGHHVKLICHLYSGAKDDDEDVKAARYARLVAKFIGRPTMLDLRQTADMTNYDEDSPELHQFDMPERPSALANNAELAGFVDGVPVLVRNKENERDRLVFMLRQAVGPQHLIPVEIAGKHATLYRKLVTVGMAVFITGIALPGKRSDNGQTVAVIRSAHVRKALPDRDFTFDEVPDWAIDIRRRWIAHVKQERARLAAAEAAKEAEDMGMDTAEAPA